MRVCQPILLLHTFPGLGARKIFLFKNSFSFKNTDFHGWFYLPNEIGLTCSLSDSAQPVFSRKRSVPWEAIFLPAPLIF
jgi:hypothetical protein